MTADSPNRRTKKKRVFLTPVVICQRLGTGFGNLTKFVELSQLVTTKNYYTFTYLDPLQITTANTKPSVFTSRFYNVV
jgi:hypothetical protein